MRPPPPGDRRAAGSAGPLRVPPWGGTTQALRGEEDSRGFRRVEFDFETGNLVAQQQAALLEPAQRQIIGGGLLGGAVDEAVEIGVCHPQFDQFTLR